MDDQLVDVVADVQQLVLDDALLLDHVQLIAVRVEVKLIFRFLELVEGDLQVEVGGVDLFLLSFHDCLFVCGDGLTHVCHPSVALELLSSQIGCETHLGIDSELAAAVHARHPWRVLPVLCLTEILQEIRSVGRISPLKHLVISFLRKVELEALIDRVHRNTR